MTPPTTFETAKAKRDAAKAKAKNAAKEGEERDQNFMEEQKEQDKRDAVTKELSTMLTSAKDGVIELRKCIDSAIVSTDSEFMRRCIDHVAVLSNQISVATKESIKKAKRSLKEAGESW